MSRVAFAPCRAGRRAPRECRTVIRLARRYDRTGAEFRRAALAYRSQLDIEGRRPPRRSTMRASHPAAVLLFVFGLPIAVADARHGRPAAEPCPDDMAAAIAERCPCD